MTMVTDPRGVLAMMYARQVRLDELETRDFPWTTTTERIDTTNKTAPTFDYLAKDAPRRRFLSGKKFHISPRVKTLSYLVAEAMYDDGKMKRVESHG
jgi:hypothetical protein